MKIYSVVDGYQESHSEFAKLCFFIFIVDGQWRSLHWNICYEEHQEGKARNHHIPINWTFCPHLT